MIVNFSELGSEIIKQRAHGLLAAQIVMEWRKKDLPDCWPETVLATAEHDDAQVELEADDLLRPQGGPVNFRMKLFEADHCLHLLNLAQSKSRYIGLLISLHMVFLHHIEAESNPEAKLFLDQQIKLQSQWGKD